MQDHISTTKRSYLYNYETLKEGSEDRQQGKGARGGLEKVKKSRNGGPYYSRGLLPTASYLMLLIAAEAFCAAFLSDPWRFQRSDSLDCFIDSRTLGSQRPCLISTAVQQAWVNNWSAFMTCLDKILVGICASLGFQVTKWCSSSCTWEPESGSAICTYTCNHSCWVSWKVPPEHIEQDT